ncbi:MAG: endonuclease III [bacterium]|nr:endonuclease III [bacterium]
MKDMNRESKKKAAVPDRVTPGNPLAKRSVTVRGKSKQGNPTIAAVLQLLEQHYPHAECALTHQTPFQLLAATILSAQCTDVMVNQVTPALFAKAPDAKTMLQLSQVELEGLIRRTGFYSNKAKNLLGMARGIVEQFQGEVPQTMQELIKLPGVGRKTASVVLGVAFHKSEGIVVDTHVARLSQRLGWSKETEPVKIERDLMKIIPLDKWIEISHQLIFRGRGLCNARKQRCGDCFLQKMCPSANLL